VNSVASPVAADVTKWRGQTVSTTTLAGYPPVDVTAIVGDTGGANSLWYAANALGSVRGIVFPSGTTTTNVVLNAAVGFSPVGMVAIWLDSITFAVKGMALVTAYNAGTPAITVSPAYASVPGAADVLVFMPARVLADRLDTQAKADVNAEVVDALATDTYAEPGQGVPTATTTLAAKLNYLYKAWRNRVTQTSSQYALYADDAATVDQKAAVSDDSTTYDRGEIASGP
jgi:hypothetical protein